MITGLRRRRIGLLITGMLGLATVAGCSSEVEGRASESTSSSPAGSSAASGSTGAPGGVEDLSAGLLPADAFGAGARVTPVTADQLGQGGAQLGGLGLDDLTITPESCAPAVKGTQPGL